MGALVKEESTITAKGQTTVPKAVRQALGVDYGDRIAFVVDDHRRVYVERVDQKESDPVVEGFLELLARDMLLRPADSIVELSAPLRDRVQGLVGSLDIDLDADIEGDVAL